MILLSAYCAVLFSFASGLLALMMNQRQTLLAVSQYSFNKFFNGNVHSRDWVNKSLEERRFPVFLRQAVFILLGLSGIFAILAGLAVLISKGVITDRIALGLPWLPWHVRFDGLSGFFFLIIGIAVCAVSLYGPGYVSSYKET
jgi:hydrogenase-4 component B